MKGLMLLMGAKPKKGGADSEEEEAPPSSGGDTSKTALGDELWSAFEDKDKAGFLAALDAYVGHCTGGGKEEETDETE